MKRIELNFIENWKATRENGRLKFALRTGIVWSVITAIISKVFELSEYSFAEVYLSKSFLSYFSFFIIIGAMIFWKFIWEKNERRYHKLLKEKEDESNG
jgi:hypothetical protein